MNIITYQYYKTTIGELILGSFEKKLCLLDFRYRKMRDAVDKRIKSGLNATFCEESCPTIDLAKDQIDAYFAGKRKDFEIPILTVGTSFQKDVWHALLQIEYGKTASYLDIAKAINNPEAVRAVASANGANAIAIIIPCHRIFASDGSLGGYGGGINVKKRLLNLEKNSSII